jgi:hypothetical protein
MIGEVRGRSCRISRIRFTPGIRGKWTLRERHPTCRSAAARHASADSKRDDLKARSVQQTSEGDAKPFAMLDDGNDHAAVPGKSANPCGLGAVPGQR